MIIRNKAQFFELWEAGCLGNRTNLWRDPQQVICQAYALGLQSIGFREMGKTGGGAWEKCELKEFWNTVKRWQQANRNFIMDDGAPDWCRTLQGEICRTFRGLEGYLDTIGTLPMRPAMAAGHMRHCSGAMVKALISKFMDASSQDDLYDLLDLYPDATIEFSCFGVDVGVLPNRNTIFWETRCY